MGLLDRFTGDPDDSDENEDEGPYPGVDHFSVEYMADDGGWHPVDGFEEMREPIEKQTFEYNNEPLKHDRYRLFAIKDNLKTEPPEGVGWTMNREGQSNSGGSGGGGADDELVAELRQLRAELQEEKESDDEPEDIEELMEKQKAALSLQMLRNPEFQRRHGDKLALDMMGVHDDGSGGLEMPDYDEFQDDPLGALSYQLAGTAVEDPGKLEEMTEAVGGGLGSFFSGAVDAAAGGGQQQQQQQQQQQPADAGTDDAGALGRTVDAGPSDPSDLVSDPDDLDDETAELVEEVAAAETARKQADTATTDDSTTLRSEGPGTESGAGAADDDHVTDALADDPDGPPPERADPDEFGDEFGDNTDSEDDTDEQDSETTDMTPSENGHDPDTDPSTDAPTDAADVAEGL